MSLNMQEWIAKFNMQPHPEGGYFVETYRSEVTLDEKKSIATVIYFLLPSGKKSTWHRIKSDEFWFYHAGSPIVVHSIENGAYQSQEVGPHISESQLPQYMVPAGAIFGASVKQENSFSLVSCVVAPGFDFADFELFSEAQMLELFPDLSAEISLLY